VAKVLPFGTCVKFVCPGLWASKSMVEAGLAQSNKTLDGVTIPPLHDDKAHIRVPGESHGYWIDWCDVRAG